MKRTMLIVSHALELGGAERSLIGFLEALDESKWEIDLFLLRQEGELMDAIPDKVHLLPQKCCVYSFGAPNEGNFKRGTCFINNGKVIWKNSGGDL